MEPEIRIGDFSKPLVEGKKTGVTEAKLDAAEQRLEAEATQAEKAAAPLKSYEERLKEAGIAKDEAAKIVDDVLMKGSYSEEIPVTKRINVRFRTRLARDTQRIQEFLEVARPQYDNHYSEILGRYCLAASLEAFGHDRFEHPKKDASRETIEKLFQDRLMFCENLADPVLRLLLVKLYKFDNKVRVALEEGAIENF